MQNTLQFFSGAINRTDSKFDVILTTLFRLRGAKFGISENDTNMMFFFAQCSRFVEQESTSIEHAYEIALSHFQCGLQNQSFWSSFLFRVSTLAEKKRLSSPMLIRCSSLISEYYRSPQAIQFLEESADALLAALQQALKAGNLPDVVLGYLALAQLREVPAPLVRDFHRLILEAREAVYEKYSSNQTADLAYALY